MRNRNLKAGVLVLSSLAFGIVVAVLKGGDAGVRDSLGNMSAPWLLLPFFAGWMARSWWRGAGLGTAACLAALAGFYVAEAFVLDLGGHPMLTNLSLAVGAGRIYFVAGAVCGPVFGALGALGARVGRGAAAIVIGMALVGEPLVVFAWQASAGMRPADGAFVTAYPSLWISEIAVGLALSGWMLARSARRGPRKAL